MNCRIRVGGEEQSFPMSLVGILSSGLSSVQTNSSAMRVTADNIANVHTPGYVRRVVQQQTLAPGGVLSGVELANVQRVINEYLDKEVLSASGNASRFDVQSTIMDQLNAALGSPGDGNSLGARMDAIYAALGQASLDPSSLTSRLGALNELDTFARTISNLSDSIASLRAGADQQISTVVTQANTLIQQIVQLNPQIQHAITVGDTGTGLLDQRDLLVQQLSQLMGIRTAPQPDGRLFVSTLDGYPARWRQLFRSVVLADQRSLIQLRDHSDPECSERTTRRRDQDIRFALRYRRIARTT
jgi:flagellar hook-associated protein 1 FlgK